MPSLPEIPDFPGKGLVGDTSKRVRLVAAGAGLAAVTVGGVVVRKALRRGDGADADPIAETPTAPPGAEAAEPPPKPKAAKPAKPKPPKPAKPKPPAPKVEKPKPPAPKPPASEPGNISGDAEPHHALNNPVGEPDETEYPDPFEKREDPRDPVDPDGQPFGEEPHPQTGSESTSEPPAALDPDRVEPPDRDD